MSNNNNNNSLSTFSNDDNNHQDNAVVSINPSGSRIDDSSLIGSKVFELNRDWDISIVNGDNNPQVILKGIKDNNKKHCTRIDIKPELKYINHEIIRDDIDYIKYMGETSYMPVYIGNNIYNRYRISINYDSGEECKGYELILDDGFGTGSISLTRDDVWVLLTTIIKAKKDL